MAGLKKKRRIQMIVAGMVLLVMATGLMGYAFQDGIELYRSPTQVSEDMPGPDERFRLGGLIKEGSWVKGDTHSFVITDTNMDIPVVYSGILPDLFDEGQGTIATGQLINGEFVASEVLAKHDEEYMPAELVDSLKEQGYYVEPSS